MVTRSGALMWVAAVLLLAGSETVAQSASEPAVLNRYKAAFLYHFANYVTWPESAQDSIFCIGVLGESRLVPLLEELATTKKVGDKRIAVNQLMSVNETRDCQLLFVTEEFGEEVTAIDSVAVRHNVLTVSDSVDTDGLAIRFVLVGDRLKFAVDRTALQRADLRASANLLKLAIPER